MSGQKGPGAVCSPDSLTRWADSLGEEHRLAAIPGNLSGAASILCGVRTLPSSILKKTQHSLDTYYVSSVVLMLRQHYLI